MNTEQFNQALKNQVIEAHVSDLVKMAYIDSMTGCFNRAALELYVQDHSVVAYTLYDVDSLKWINDHYGHAMGDRLLRLVAAMLRDDHHGAPVFRVGGDEFVIVGNPYNPLCHTSERRHGGHADKYCSHGTGTTLDAADFKLYQNKAQREQTHVRMPAGCAPTWAKDFDPRLTGPHGEPVSPLPRRRFRDAGGDL